MTIRELVESDRQAWNSFVGSNPYGDALQSWEWGLVKADGGDWRTLRLGMFDGNDCIVGGASILMRRLPVIGSLYYAPRGPVLADWSDFDGLKALIEAIQLRAKSDGAMMLKIDPAIPSDGAASLHGLSPIGFRRPADQDAQGFGGTQPKAVMILDIAGMSDDALLAGFKPQCRRNVRIADKKGVEAIAETQRSDLTTFYDLLKVTSERDGFTVRPQRYFGALWDNLIENGLGKLFLTRFEGQYLSGALCFRIGDKCVYVYGASSNEHRNAMPNYAMQWSMIRWARDIGCSTYDFRGVAPVKPGDESNPQSEHLQGLNRFKEGFGARFVEYIGELDLPMDASRYWLWAKAKPAAQHLLRRARAAAPARTPHASAAIG